MSYEVAFLAKASAETVGMPEHAFAALMQTLTSISRDPWGATEVEDPGEPAMRWAIFAQRGIVSVYVDEARHTVRVHDILWSG